MSEIKLIDQICSLMMVGALYPLSVIKENYKRVFGDKKLSKIATCLRNESAKTEGKVDTEYLPCRTKLYGLTIEYDPEKNEAITESDDTRRIAAVILDSVQKQNIKALDEWLSTNLVDKIQEIVEDQLRIELKNEVIPAIDNSINERIELSKDKMKELLLEIFSDTIKINRG